MLGLLLLGFVSCAAVDPEPPTALEIVCAALEADGIASCDGVYSPEIIVTALLPALAGPTLLGVIFYDEERIFVNINANIPLDSIIIHEMIHWVVRKGRNFDTPRCESEDIARIYTEKLTGQPAGDWREGYGCVGQLQRLM